MEILKEELRVLLTAEDKTRLARLTALLGVSENEAIRRAIVTELFVRTSLAQGSKLVIAQPGEPLKEVNF